ncbi:MAG: protein kinase [Planctomycetes bacterium]|nr:protein kinase [Planctomycetota bacterium]
MKSCPRCKKSFREENIQFCPFDGTPLEGGEGESLYANRLLAGRYRVYERIGSGEMGAIFRGQELATKADVAIRFVPVHLVTMPEIRQDLSRRLEIAEKLDHPNLVRVLGHGITDEGALYVVMEQVEGERLSDLLEEFKELAHELAVAILDQVLAALEHAHSKGLVHGYLNPKNVFVLTKGNARGRYVKVMDLGLAKVVPTVSDRSVGKKETARVSGDPNYMAPEQAAGLAADHRSDLYAAGLVLFRMLSGRLPFDPASRRPAEGEADPGQVRADRRPTLTLSAAAPHLSVPSAFEGLVARALRADPAARPRSAAEFRRELARSASRGRRARLARGTALVILLALVGGAFYVWFNFLRGGPAGRAAGEDETHLSFSPEPPPDHAGRIAALLSAAGRPPLTGMVRFQAGKFDLGEAGGGDDEKPRPVSFPEFWLGPRPVSGAEFAEFLEAKGGEAPAGWKDGTPHERDGGRPVVGVTFYQAEAYAAWKGMRLPSEAMWERAARSEEGRGGRIEFPLDMEWTATPSESLSFDRVVRFGRKEPWHRDAYYAGGAREDLGFRCAFWEGGEER